MAASGWSDTTRDGWGLQFSVEAYVNWHTDRTISVTVRACSNCVGCWVNASARTVDVWVDGHEFYYEVDGVYQDGFYDFGYQTQTWDVGYGAGSITVESTGVMHGTPMDGTINLNTFSVAYGDTYTNAAAPSMLSVSARGTDSAQFVWNNNATEQSPITQSVIQFKDEISYSSGFVNNDSVGVSSGVWERSVLAAGNIVVTRGYTQSYHGGAATAPSSLMYMSAPAAMTGLSIAKNGTFGATLSWTNRQGTTDYQTRIYEGTVSYNSSAYTYSPNHGAKLLATLAPGVSSWSSASLWSSTAGLTAKTFTVVQYSSFAAWTNSYKNNANMSGAGYVDGLSRASNIQSVSLTNGASAPSAPTSVSASYITSNGKVSNTQAIISWSSAAATSSKPRSGFKIMCNGAVVGVVQDSSGTATTWTKTVTFTSMVGTSYVLSVAAYGVGGQSASVSSSTMYGTLPSPAISSHARGYSSVNGYYFSASAAQSGANYAHSWQSQYSYDNSTWTSVNTTTILVHGSAYSFGAAYVRFRLVPSVGIDVESHASSWTTLTIAAASNGVASVSAAQSMVSGVGECTITFPAALTSGSETATTYTLHIDGSAAAPGAVTIKATGASSYTYTFSWMSTTKLNISVVANLNGYLSKAATTSYTYVPQDLQAPELVSISAAATDGWFNIVFKDAKYGSPFTSNGSYGYKYGVYVDAVAVTEQTPTATTLELNSSSHIYSFYCMSPASVSVTVTATDSAGSTSSQSEELLISYDSTGNGIFVNNSEAVIARCKFEQIDLACVRAKESTLYVEDSDMSSDGARYYDLDDDTHINEANTRYGE